MKKVVFGLVVVLVAWLALGLLLFCGGCSGTQWPLLPRDDTAPGQRWNLGTPVCTEVGAK